MLFRQLEYFVALARERHFARAAASCYVSQPALSASIAKLEAELDVALIYRDHAFQGLTPEGERLVIWARRILAEHDAFKLEVQAMRSSIEGTLRLGVVPGATTTAALPVSAFTTRHPLATVQLSSRHSAGELLRMLRDFELDAAITYASAGEHPGLIVVPLYRERYVLVAPTGLRASATPTTDVTAAESAGWRDAAELPLALLSGHMRGRQIIDEAFAANGLTVRPQVETDSIAALYSLVRTGDWATVVPHSWIHVFGRLRAEADVVPLTGPSASARVAVVTDATEPGSPVARAFADAAAGLHLDEVFDGMLAADRPADPAATA